MKQILILLLTLVVIGLNAQTTGREVILLDKEWSFQLNDSEWEKVSIPHDWAISEDFDLNIDVQIIKVKEDGERKAKLRTGRTGALPWIGTGWYRKLLPIARSDSGKRVFIEFDGAMSNARVYLNEHFIGEWPYGYTSFSEKDV